MNWDSVEMIRNAQASNQKRFDEEHIAVQSKIEEAIKSETFNQLAVPRMTELEGMIFKMRSELIDYIVAHGLVDGLILDGVLQPVENGKIVLTKELIGTITEKLGYTKENDVIRLVAKYLPEHDYVSDGKYVHTDNNFRDEDVTKLNGIEDGAEVNKIIDLIFNGVSVLDDGTRVATITITPEDIKQWYESNPDTNAFTDAEKAKLKGISDGAEVNRVDDVIVNGRSVLDENKKALLTKEVIKEAYESNPDTNAFTDAEKERLADINSISYFVGDANAIRDLQSSTDYDMDGAYAIVVNARITLTSADKKTQQRTIQLQGRGDVDSQNYIVGGDLVLSYINPNADSDGLQQATITGFADTGSTTYHPTIGVVVNRDNFNATSVSVEFLSFSHSPINVVDVVDEHGDSYVANGLARISKTVFRSGLVPYTDAERDVDLGEHKLTADMVNASTGVNISENGSINFDTSDSTSATQTVTQADVTFKTDKGVLLHLLTGDPSDQNHATNKKYVDKIVVDRVPYTGANTGINMNNHNITNVDNLWANGSIIACGEITLRDTYDAQSSGARLVARAEVDGLRLEQGTNTGLANLYVAEPTAGKHAATKDYVDEAVAGGGSGSGAIVECEAGEEDFRVITMNAAVACITGKLAVTTFNISDGAITGDDATTITKSFTLRAAQKIVFSRWYASSTTTFYRSINPVVGGNLYLTYNSSAPTRIGVQLVGVNYSSAERIVLTSSSTSSPLPTGDIDGNSTSKYYKYA